MNLKCGCEKKKRKAFWEAPLSRQGWGGGRGERASQETTVKTQSKLW